MGASTVAGGTGTTAAGSSASTSKAGANALVMAPAGGVLAVMVVVVAYI
jgi:hypothetical protein